MVGAARGQLLVPVFIVMLGGGRAGKESQNLELGEGRVPGVPGERSWRESPGPLGLPTLLFVGGCSRTLEPLPRDGGPRL